MRLHSNLSQFFPKKGSQKLAKNLKDFYIVSALDRLYHMPYGTTEHIIEARLIAKYGITLKQACRQLIDKSVWELSPKGELVIYWNDSHLQELAQFITYGPGGSMGSLAVKYLFKF